MLSIQILILLLCFYFLATTADFYLSPALAHISKMLHMSENLAGVTLLALGNGAPDIFSTIAASSETDGLPLSIATLVGGSFFVGNLVLGLVILKSPDPI